MRRLTSLALALLAVILMFVVTFATYTPPRRGSLVSATRDAPITLVTLSAGERYSCGLTATGRAFCWGADWYGQLGAGGVDGHCAESIYAKGACARAPVEVY